MRIALLAPERSEFHAAGTVLVLGCGADDGLRLSGAGVQPGHVRLHHDARGYVLEVAEGAPPIHVNARLVRRRALVHPGDQLSIGAAQVMLLGEHAPESCPADAVADATVAPGALALRGVGGLRSGAVLMVAPTLELGVNGLPLAPGASGPRLRLLAVRGRPALLAEGMPMASLPMLNGHAVASAWLHDGDQIALGAQRYRVDAPAWAVRDAFVHTFIPPEAPSPEDTAGPRREVWWLLLTAAAIALGLALFLALRR